MERASGAGVERKHDPRPRICRTNFLMKGEYTATAGIAEDNNSQINSHLEL